MSGWGFDLGGISSLGDLGNKFQQLKLEVESSIDASIRGQDRSENARSNDETDGALGTSTTSATGGAALATTDAWFGGLDVLRTLVAGDDDGGAGSPSSLDGFAGAEFGFTSMPNVKTQAVTEEEHRPPERSRGEGKVPPSEEDYEDEEGESDYEEEEEDGEVGDARDGVDSIESTSDTERGGLEKIDDVAMEPHVPVPSDTDAAVADDVESGSTAIIQGHQDEILPSRATDETSPHEGEETALCVSDGDVAERQQRHTRKESRASTTMTPSAGSEQKTEHAQRPGEEPNMPWKEAAFAASMELAAAVEAAAAAREGRGIPTPSPNRTMQPQDNNGAAAKAEQEQRLESDMLAPSMSNSKNGAAAAAAEARFSDLNDEDTQRELGTDASPAKGEAEFTGGDDSMHLGVSDNDNTAVESMKYEGAGVDALRDDGADVQTTQGTAASHEERKQQHTTPEEGGEVDATPSITSLQQQVASLQEALRAREAQLERFQSRAAASSQETESVAATVAAAAQQQDMQDRLEAAERKVSALAKAREILKRQLARSEGLLAEKAAEVTAVMEEGENLSKKQLKLETTIKKLRSQSKELREEGERLQNAVQVAEAKAEAASNACRAAETASASAEERHAQELASQRRHYEQLVSEARKEAAAADQRAGEAAKAGAARKLREAESRIEALQSTVEQLREELERRRIAADEREDVLNAEVAALQRRCTEAEARQQDMQERLPEATAPLLRQLESMQAAAEAHAAAAAEAERTFMKRVAVAEAIAAESKDHAETSRAALAEAQARREALDMQVQEARGALREAEAASAAADDARKAAMDAAAALRRENASLRESQVTMERVYAQQVESLQARESAAVAAAELAQEELRSATSLSGSVGQANQHEAQNLTPAELTKEGKGGGGGVSKSPAPPGYRWELVQEHHGNGGGGALDARQGHSMDTEDSALSPFSLDNGRLPLSTPAIQPHPQSQREGASQGVGDYGSAAGNGSPLAKQQSSRGSGLFYSLPSGGSNFYNTEAHVEALQRTVRELQATRDRLSEELVRLERMAAEGRTAAEKVVELQKELSAMQHRYAKAVELLGEREERVEELQADLEDVKDAFRGQLEALADEAAALRTKVAGLENGG